MQPQKKKIKALNQAQKGGAKLFHIHIISRLCLSS